MWPSKDVAWELRLYRTEHYFPWSSCSKSFQHLLQHNGSSKAENTKKWWLTMECFDFISQVHAIWELVWLLKSKCWLMKSELSSELRKSCHWHQYLVLTERWLYLLVENQRCTELRKRTAKSQLLILMWCNSYCFGNCCSSSWRKSSFFFLYSL